MQRHFCFPFLLLLLIAISLPVLADGHTVPYEETFTSFISGWEISQDADGSSAGYAVDGGYELQIITGGKIRRIIAPIAVPNCYTVQLKLKIASGDGMYSLGFNDIGGTGYDFLINPTQQQYRVEQYQSNHSIKRLQDDHSNAIKRTDYNILKVAVVKNRAQLFVNDQLLTTVALENSSDKMSLAVVAANWGNEPLMVHIDNFSVTAASDALEASDTGDPKDAILLPLANPASALAVQSTIIEAEGLAARCNDQSGIKTEDAAFFDVMHKAIKSALAIIEGEIPTANRSRNDLINAYNQASVRILQVIEAGFFKDSKLGVCYKVKVKAEVIPDEALFNKAASDNPGLIDDPAAPLQVKIWTAKTEYKKGDKFNIYIKGNKPFFARVVYRDATGNMLQILPNPYRENNYFLGGVIYELPSKDDRFELAVTPPFGTENAIIYASTMQLGSIDLKDTLAGVYTVKNSLNEVSVKSRGIVIKPKSVGVESGDSSGGAEFAEARTMLKTQDE